MIKLKFLLFIIASANLNLILFSIWCFITFVASLVHCECNSLHTFIFIEYFMSGQHHAFQKRKKVIHLKREEQQLTSIIIQSIRVIWLYSRVVDKIFWNFPLHSFLKHMSTLFIFNKTSFKSPESYSTVSWHQNQSSDSIDIVDKINITRCYVPKRNVGHLNEIV